MSYPLMGPAMPLHWLCYQHNNQISVVIEPGASIIHARMRAALASLDQGEFTEGHELDCQVPKEMIGADCRSRKQRGCWLRSNVEPSASQALTVLDICKHVRLVV